jgi:Signal transduction histidine kinase
MSANILGWILAAVSFVAFLFFFVKYVMLKREIIQMENKIEQLLNDNSVHYLYTKTGVKTENLTYQINQLLNRYQNETIALNHEQTTRKQLISNLSHDLKTPLAGIIGYLEAIENEMVDKDEQKEYLETALKKSYDLKHRISELFELVRIDADELILQLEKVEIGEQLRMAAIEFVPRLEEELFQYEFKIFDEPYFILVDQKAFGRIIQNLIGNVFDHANKGKYLAINAFVEDKSIMIDVIDHGGGIAEKNVKYIFERLYQADEARMNHGGLGLAITYELVKRMNGSITLVENTTDKTVFRLIFPMAT